jgi:hypothetical protein
LKVRYIKGDGENACGTLGVRKFSLAPEQRYISAVPAWKQRISQHKPRHSFRSSRAGFYALPHERLEMSTHEEESKKAKTRKGN